MPRLGRPEVCGGAGEDEPVDALGRLERERHRDHPADRDAAGGDAVEAELVEEPEEAARQRFDGARLLGELGRPVPGVVVREDAEALRQLRELPVPQLLRGAERVGQHEDRPVPGPGGDGRASRPRLLVLAERPVDERLGRAR